MKTVNPLQSDDQSSKIVKGRASLTLIHHLLLEGKGRRDQESIGISIHWNLMKAVAHPQTERRSLAREGSTIGG